jgi:hypothetical protein
MDHPIYRVRGFEHVGPYAIRIVFDDQTEHGLAIGHAGPKWKAIDGNPLIAVFLRQVV